jgi:hypothetical protein
MTPDYDLSNLPTSQADLLIHLQVDAILGQILADQAKRLGFPLALRLDLLRTLETAELKR